MRPSKISLLILALTSTVSLAQLAPSVDTQNGKVISAPNKSQIVSNVLCQNVPAVTSSVAAVAVYNDYMAQVSDLFASNARDIKKNTIGINQDSQMIYTLNSPVDIAGIDFDTVNINRLKDVNGSYYQITASKPLTSADQGKIKNIPHNDNLTLSTKDQKLEIICNVKVPMVK